MQQQSKTKEEKVNNTNGSIFMRTNRIRLAEKRLTN
jgi:hypothetical protein